MKVRLFFAMVLVLGTIGSATAQYGSALEEYYLGFLDEGSEDSVLCKRGYNAYLFEQYEEAYRYYSRVSKKWFEKMSEEDFLAYAISCINFRKLESAIDIYELGLRKSQYAHVLQGEIFKKLEELDNADPQTLPQEEIYPLLRYCNERHQYERTLELCDKVYNYIGYNEVVNYYKAEAYYSMGALAKAESCLENLVNISSGRILDSASLSFFNKWAFLAGKMYYADGDVENAFFWMNEVMNNRVLNGGLYRPDGMSWVMYNRLEKQDEVAKELLPPILAWDMDADIRYFSQFLMADILQRQGFESASLTSWKNLVSDESLNGDNVFSHIACNKMGLLQEADEYFDLLLRKESMTEYDYYSAAYGYIMRGDKERTLAYAKRAIDASHDPMWAQYFIKDDVFAPIKKQVKGYMKEKEKMVEKKYPKKKYSYKQTEIPFYWENGIMIVECYLNGMKKKMIFDSGASYSNIGISEAYEMYTRGHLSEDDILFPVDAQVADGRVVESNMILVKEIKVGDFVLKDVRTMVDSNDSNGMLLLGQSVLTRFEKFEIDYENFVIRLTYKVEK